MPAASVSSPASRAKRSSDARAKARASASASPRAGRTGAGARVRWDRVGRAAMLAVAAAVVYLYLSAGVHMFSTWRQSHHDNAVVATMRHEHALLVSQHEKLSKRTTLEEEARRLGMIKKNEQPYLVGPLPSN